MFYEEKVIKGVLSFRTEPNGVWKAMSAERITEKLMEIKSALDENRGKNVHINAYGSIITLP